MAKKKVKIKKSWIKWAVIIVVLVLIALIYIPTLEKEKEIEPEPTEIVVPGPDEKGAQFGDLLKINYVLSMTDGTVIDTNNDTLAKKHGVENYVKGPYSFILGQSDKIYGQQGRVKTFDEAIKGLKVGDVKTIELKPSEDVLAYTINITDKKQRRTSIGRIHRFSRKQYADKFLGEPIIGNIISNPDEYPWPYEILNVTEKSVFAKVILKNDDVVVLPGTEWESRAVDVAQLVVTFEQNPEIGQVIVSPYGTAEVIDLTRGYIWLKHNPVLDKEFEQMEVHEMGKGGLVYDFKVWDITEENFAVRRINYPQQEKLILDVEVLEIVPDVKDIIE